jgi:hypothetical protein
MTFPRQPEVGETCVAMRSPKAEVAVQGGPCFRAEGVGSATPPFADEVNEVRLHLNVTLGAVTRRISQAREFGESAPRIYEQADDRGVAARFKVTPRTGRKERLQLMIREDCGRLLYHPRLSHSGHRGGADQPFADGPLEELLERTETVRCRAAGAAGEKVAHPTL